MKNSQKGAILQIVIILAVLIIGGGAYYIYNNNQNKPTSFNNYELINTYPVLANENSWRTKLISSDNPQKWVVSDKNITIQAVDYSGKFVCGNAQASFSKFSSYNNGGFGGWNNISIISCSDYYFVFEYGDAGPLLFGPFDQSNTSKTTAISKTNTNSSVSSNIQSSVVLPKNPEILASLVNGWKQIALSIIPNFPDPSRAFYGYPYIIQFIGKNSIIVSYQDDFNPLYAVISYNPTNEKFSYRDGLRSSPFEVNEALWDTWRTRYGDISVAPQTYQFSSTRTGDVVYPSDWKLIAKNPFVTDTGSTNIPTSITVISPNGGETLVTGKEYTIKWFDTETPSNVNIYAVNIDRGGPGTNISGNISRGSSGIDDSSSYFWKVGTIYPLSDSLDGMPIMQYPPDPGKYKIMVCNTSTKKCDSSDNYFNITIDSSLAPSITLLSPKIGETVKIGRSFLIQWNTNRILPPEYKFIINAGSGDRPFEAYQASTAYGYYYLVDKYRVTDDILSEVTPGQYKIKISLYDGVAPKDANGKTCTERVKTGGQLYCNTADLYGKLITESTSDNYLTITN